MKSAAPEPRRRFLGRLLAVAGVLTAAGGRLPPARAQSQTAEVTQLKLERSDDGIYLSTALKFDLPPPVLDVLEKGIAIHFVAEAELFRERWYWTDQKLGQAARHMRLAYQPLTRRWRLSVSPVPITTAGAGVTLSQNFDSLDEALDTVRRIGRLRVADASEVGDDGARYPVVFRFRLDTSQLPRPFQIGLVGQSDWNVAVERSVRLPLEKMS
ncbi:MAG: DUF4390 domain-containing protein [Xenophilus sp.]